MVTLRSHTREKAWRSSWGILPPEIQRRVLEYISYREGWSRATLVCKEWQVFIAAKKLRRLELNAESVKGLVIITRQRDFIQQIYLNIHLDCFDCELCQGEFALYENVSRTVKTALRDLFEVLKTWDPTNCITLELNACSPSDQGHWFKNHLFGLKHEDGGDLLKEQRTWHDPVHGWVDGKQVAAPSLGAILRIFEEIDTVLPSDTPEVPAIKKLVIRRQMRRRISSYGLRSLLDKFPRLESIDYEPWRLLYRCRYARFLEVTGTILEHILPQHVKSVTIFEDFNEQILEAFRNDDGNMESDDSDDEFETPETRRIRQLQFGTVLASKSRNFQHLSVSFMIEAQDFFKACEREPSYTWPGLRSLILTTPILTGANRKATLRLLASAGRVAQRMPQLETMAIWYCSQEKACAVVFHRNRQSKRPWTKAPTLTWRGTCDFDFSEEVVRTWQRVISPYTSDREGSILARIERVEGDIKSHGDAIHHLRLPDGVIHPTSLQQIRKEGILQQEAWAVKNEEEIQVTNANQGFIWIP